MNKIWLFLLKYPLQFLVKTLKVKVISHAKIWIELNEIYHPKSDVIEWEEFIYLKDVELYLISSLIYKNKVQKGVMPSSSYVLLSELKEIKSKYL